MQKLMIALLLAGAPLAAATLPAAAEGDETACTTAPKSSWMSEDDAKAKATALGYDVRDIKTESGCFEVYAMKDGQKVVVQMNPVDGTVTNNPSEDENDE